MEASGPSARRWPEIGGKSMDGSPENEAACSLQPGITSKNSAVEAKGQLDLGAKLPLSLLMLEGGEKWVRAREGTK